MGGMDVRGMSAGWRIGHGHVGRCIGIWAWMRRICQASMGRCVGVSGHVRGRGCVGMLGVGALGVSGEGAWACWHIGAWARWCVGAGMWAQLAGAVRGARAVGGISWGEQVLLGYLCNLGA